MEASASPGGAQGRDSFHQDNDFVPPLPPGSKLVSKRSADEANCLQERHPKSVVAHLL